MKKYFIFFVLVCLLVSAMAVNADTCADCTDECEKHTVTYDTNNCLVVAPVDCNEYGYAEQVNVLFEPVQYKTGLIFYGWDWDNDGVADFGYDYNSFLMPDYDVTLKAICIPMYYGPVGPHCRPGCHH